MGPQGENPCQVLLVLPGLMSVRFFYFFPCDEAALVSIKESSTPREDLVNATVGYKYTRLLRVELANATVGYEYTRLLCLWYTVTVYR